MIKNVKGFDGYFVSNTGQVFSSKRNQWRELKLQTNVDGYNVVNLYRDGKYYHCRVARLVAEAFIPNPQGLPVVNHIDHSRTNDNVNNLEWCTEAENSQASIKLHPERWKARANISYQDAEEICQMISEGARNKEIVSALGVTLDTVKKIRQGDAWVEVSSNYAMRPSYRGISEETVRWVCNKIVEGLKNSEILAQSTSKNLTSAMIKRIRSKDSWSRISNEYF
jgi:hypothetical protein